MTIATKNNYEPRNCFEQEKHDEHLWDVNTYGIPGKPAVSRYFCDGEPPRPEPDWTQEQEDKAMENVHASIAAHELTESRKEVYGDPIVNMTGIAMMWSGFLGITVQPWQVPIMYALGKMHRMNGAPDYSDNPDDTDGYLDLYRQVIGDDMIVARTVEEYLNKKMDRQGLDALAQAGFIDTPHPDYPDSDETLTAWFNSDPELARLRTHKVGCVLPHRHEGPCNNGKIMGSDGRDHDA